MSRYSGFRWEGGVRGVKCERRDEVARRRGGGGSPPVTGVSSSKCLAALDELGPCTWCSPCIGQQLTDVTLHRHSTVLYVALMKMSQWPRHEISREQADSCLQALQALESDLGVKPDSVITTFPERKQVLSPLLHNQGLLRLYGLL